MPTLRVEECRLIHVRAILGGCILKVVARLGPKRGHCVRHTVLGEEHNQIPVLKPVRVLTCKCNNVSSIEVFSMATKHMRWAAYAEA
jgi:hypothetical protein